MDAGHAVTAAGTSVLQASPEELRRAARLLRGIGGDLGELGTCTVAATRLGDGWAGVAALEQQARAGALRDLVERSALPAEQVAGALDRCAAAAEDAGAQVRSWTRQVEDRAAELTALRALPPPPEPLLEQAWRRRMQEVEAELERTRQLIRRAEESFDLVRQETARVLARAWEVVAEIDELRRIVMKTLKARQIVPWVAVHTALTSRLLVALGRQRWARDAVVRAIALDRSLRLRERLAQLWAGIRSGGRHAGKVRFTPGPLGMMAAWGFATRDVWSGGGYDGWRGGLTHVLAAGAVIGGPVAIAGLFFPPAVVAAPVGVALIGIYQAWMLGNAVYDGFPTLVRYARLVVRHAPAVRSAVYSSAVRAAHRARARAGEALRDLRTRTVRGATGLGRRITDGAGRAVDRVEDVRDRVGRLVDRLPDTGPLRDRLRELGDPIRLPVVPLGPTLRAPVELGRWSLRRPVGGLP